MSGPLFELSGTPYLPWVTHPPTKSVSVSDSHLDWGHPEGRCVTALGVQHMTQDHSMPQNEGVVPGAQRLKALQLAKTLA